MPLASPVLSSKVFHRPMGEFKSAAYSAGASIPTNSSARSIAKGMDIFIVGLLETSGSYDRAAAWRRSMLPRASPRLSRMSKHLQLGLIAFLWILGFPQPAAADAADPVSADSAVRQEFVAAMQRVRLHAPDAPDSSALKGYAIYDYLVAARLRRDLPVSPTEELDTVIDTFLHVHANQPVAHPLRREWLGSLAERRRGDWFLPRASDVTDPRLLCYRLQGLLETGDTQGLGAAALARWSLPQRQPGE